jgi:nucleotide-binding universal stress UspA family protein
VRWLEVYDRILVPLDGSESAEMALPYAEAIAAKFKSEITLISVVESENIDAKHLYRSYLDHAAEIVMRELKEWEAREGVVVRDELISGKPANVIIEYATEHKESLIVMASHGSSGRGAWLLGSVAAKILRASDTPVLLVKVPAREEAIRERRLFNSILLPLDGSKLGEAAIPHAVALAREVGARLTLFRVVEQYSDGGRAERYVGSGDESKKMAHAYLEKVRRVLKETGLDASSAISIGDPAPEIISYAAANQVDLICLSSHGESGVTHWVFGSVTDKLLHAGDTPVIMVRRTKKA